MTLDPDTSLPDEQDADAGEYVLGTLDAAARAAFEARLAGDTSLQASVYAWQDRLLALAARTQPLAPEAGVWDAVEKRLLAVPRLAAEPAPVPAAAPARASESAPAPSPATPGAPAANDPMWRRLRRWQAASALGLAASVALATLLVVRGPAGLAPGLQPADVAAAGTRFVAVLEAPDKSTGWVIEATTGGTLRLIPVANTAPVPGGKTLQFWTKADGAAGPTSLGLVRTSQVVELPASSLPTLQAHQLFELTLEPEGGSPIGRPTGPVVYIGRTVRM